MNDEQKRFVAVKTTARNIVTGVYVVESDDKPNYVRTNSGEEIYRLNLIALLVKIEKQGSITNLSLDDGTSMVVARFFEEQTGLDSFQVGDVLLVVGRVRKYGDELYISPDFAKKTDPKWMKVRSAELKQETPQEVTVEVKEPDVVVEEVQEEQEVVETQLPSDKIIEYIKEHDSGGGVDMEVIVSEHTFGDTDEILMKMLEKGEIFQISPGKVKVL